MLADPDAIKTDGTKGELYVYAVCIACALAGALWIMLNGVLLNSIPLFFNVFAQSIFGELIIIVILYITEWNDY